MKTFIPAILGIATIVLGYVAWRKRWQAYDPSWLVKLAEQQLPEKPELAEALRACTRYSPESDAYYYFVSGRKPNQEGSAWQFKENISLRDPEEGELILDVLKDGRVGGVEFLSRLL